MKDQSITMSNKNEKLLPLIKETKTNENTIIRYPVNWVRKIPQFKKEKIKANFFENLGIILLNNQNKIIDKFLNSLNSLEYAKKLELEDIELLFEYLEKNPKFSLGDMLENLILISERGEKLNLLKETSLNTRKEALIQRLQNIRGLPHMDHRILDIIHNRIIFEPYDIESDEIEMILDKLDFKWKITARSPHYPLKSILIEGTPQNEDDSIFTRSEKEEKRIESMVPVKLSLFNKIVFKKMIVDRVEVENKKFKEFQDLVEKYCEEKRYNLEWNKIQPIITNQNDRQVHRFSNGFEKEIGEKHMWRYLYGEMEGFIVKRYIDGWVLSSTVISVGEEIKPYWICITPIIDVQSVLKDFNDTIEHLYNIPKKELYWDYTPPPMFDDRIEKELDKSGRIICLLCETDLTAKIYKNPTIISEYVCECGAIIGIKLKFGVYRETFFFENEFKMKEFFQKIDKNTLSQKILRKIENLELKELRDQILVINGNFEIELRKIIFDTDTFTILRFHDDFINNLLGNFKDIADKNLFNLLKKELFLEIVLEEMEEIFKV